MRSQQRQMTWLAGRVLAKQLLVACLSDGDSDNKFESPAEIHIESRSATNRLGIRPRVSVRGQELDWGLSIAHSNRGVLVAVAADASVGVDLVCSRRVPERIARLVFFGRRAALAGGPAEPRARGRAIVGDERGGLQGMPRQRGFCSAAHRNRVRRAAVRHLRACDDCNAGASTRTSRRWRLPIGRLVFQNHYPSSC